MALAEAVAAASRPYPLPAGFRPSYGTAGFRAVADLLHSTMFRCRSTPRAPQPPAARPPERPPPLPACRCGILMAARALKTRQITGICITASHNPAPDNGVKLVEPTGEMLCQEWEVRCVGWQNVLTSRGATS